MKKEREGGVMKLDPEDRQRINKLAAAFGKWPLSPLPSPPPLRCVDSPTSSLQSPPQPPPPTPPPPKDAGKRQKGTPPPPPPA